MPDRNGPTDENLRGGAAPLPRGAGADVPQSHLQDFHMGLLYTEQNFNELVAANTAMTTELSAAAEREGILRKEIENLEANISDLRMSASSAHEAAAALRDEKAKLATQIVDANDAAGYEAERAAELQRKLDRSLGYLDRVIDDQEAYSKPEMTERAPSPIGPDLASIPTAYRRGRMADSDFSGIAHLAPGSMIRGGRPRRF